MTHRTETPDDNEKAFRSAFEMLSVTAGRMMNSPQVGLSPQDVARVYLGVAIGSLTATYGDHATVDALRSAADALEAQLPTAQ